MLLRVQFFTKVEFKIIPSTEHTTANPCSRIFLITRIFVHALSIWSMNTKNQIA